MNRNIASAKLLGNTLFPDIRGVISFTQSPRGVIVRAELYGLPTDTCKIFGFHIHEIGDCTSVGNGFPNSGSHYNPGNTRHPCHAGDMPPLFGCNGYAYLEFLTDRFTVPEILGRSVIVHSSPDDFTTDPSGNSGDRIACGLIEQVRKRYR